MNVHRSGGVDELTSCGLRGVVSRWGRGVW
jgi:hypothetical protein